MSDPVTIKPPHVTLDPDRNQVTVSIMPASGIFPMLSVNGLAVDQAGNISEEEGKSKAIEACKLYLEAVIKLL